LTKSKCLVGRIDVMEMERTDVSVVSAPLTGPTGLGYQRFLDLAPALGDCLRATSQTPIASAYTLPELGSAVPCAVKHYPPSGGLHDAQTLRLPGVEPILSQPVTDRRLAASDGCRDLPD
jgi:hypothetical protein